VSRLSISWDWQSGIKWGEPSTKSTGSIFRFLSLIRSIGPQPVPKMLTEAAGEPASREKEKYNASQNAVLSSGREA